MFFYKCVTVVFPEIFFSFCFSNDLKDFTDNDTHGNFKETDGYEIKKM